jgi:hypothetical protein
MTHRFDPSLSGAGRHRARAAAFVVVLLVLVAVAVALGSCESLASGEAALTDDAPSTAGPAPAGADCEATSDCRAEQTCVDGRCRPLRTTVEGELLAAAAAEQLAAGDARASYETYVTALRAYEQASVPIPPDVLCGSAEAALSCSREEVPRELAARRADACFRGSLPADPARARVLAKLAALRYEGLELAAFDQAEPPSQFFTAPRSRPDPGAVQVRIALEGTPGPGGDEIDQRLKAAPLAQAATACFLEDWELHHQRTVEARLDLEVSSRLRDMGEYDIYEAHVAVSRTGLGERGFSPCVARALESAFAESFRMSRIVSWRARAVVRATSR